MTTAWCFQHYTHVPNGGDEEEVTKRVFEAMFSNEDFEIRKSIIENEAVRMLEFPQNAHLIPIFAAHGFSAQNPIIESIQVLNALRNAARHSGIRVNMCCFGLPTLVQIGIETAQVIFDQGQVSSHTVLNFYDQFGIMKSFALLQALTRCNYGPVYKGIEVIRACSSPRFIALETVVAIKKIERQRLEHHLNHHNFHLNEDPVKEIAALQYLDHKTSGVGCPHVLPLIMAGLTNDAIFTITPFCDRGDLFTVVERYNRLPSVQARTFFKQIVAGILHLHALGIQHHDLSLENVLWFATRNSRPMAYVMDLGMAVKTCGPTSQRFLPLPVQRHRQLDIPPGVHSYFSIPVSPSSQWPCRCGKPDYLAPEFLRPFRSFDLFAPDVFALGVTLYIMLVGVPPFDVNRANELHIPYEDLLDQDECFKYIKRRRLQDLLNAWNINIPLAAIDLLQRLLHPNPSLRITIPQILFHPWFVGAT